MREKRLILHIVYRYSIGGLEKVMSECINNLPQDAHVVVSLTTVSDYAAENLTREISIHALNKRAGNDFSLYVKLYRLMRKLQPDVLHTYNLATLEYQLIGFLARVQRRIHAEHGRDISDPAGRNKKYNLLRRLLNPFIHHWVPVSDDLRQWLMRIGIPKKKIRLIYNGVDITHFHPDTRSSTAQLPEPDFPSPDKTVIGTIGRIDPIKNHAGLFNILREIFHTQPEWKDQLALVIVGDGPLYHDLKNRIAQEGLENNIWMPGARYNIADILHSFTVFVLPSIAEGVPMTVLEAMASGIPVICSDVGGIPEIITDNSGVLLPPTATTQWAQSLIELLNNPAMAAQYSRQARLLMEEKYSIQTMVEQYQQLYFNA